MEEFATITCISVKQEVKTDDDLVSTSKLVSPDEDDVNITEDMKRNVGLIETNQSYMENVVKEEFKEEFVEDSIKSRGFWKTILCYSTPTYLGVLKNRFR
ncbi:hypothetical protein FQR65_LT04974 [Abscondita terminalis]|nr:hypothetical protein FQR65_LT04974 [Abscondita terminalis]